jgi:hypothetical protein
MEEDMGMIRVMHKGDTICYTIYVCKLEGNGII